MSNDFEGHVGPTLGHTGFIPYWTLVAHVGSILGLCSAMLGQERRVYLDPSVKAQIIIISRPCRRHVRSILGNDGSMIGVMLGHVGPVLGQLGLYWAYVGRVLNYLRMRSLPNFLHLPRIPKERLSII